MSSRGANVIQKGRKSLRSISGTAIPMNGRFNGTIKAASAINEEDRATITRIFRENMGPIYELLDSKDAMPDEGYLFEKNATYIIVGVDSQIIAYSMVKVEWDDLDAPEFPVLYIYELQVFGPWRSQGIGRLLISALVMLLRLHLPDIGTMVSFILSICHLTLFSYLLVIKSTTGR